MQTESEPQSKIWTSDDYDVSVGSSSVKTEKSGEMLTVREAMHVWGRGCMGNLCTFLSILL